MKPAPFDYYAPQYIKEALITLHALGYSGNALACEQGLEPEMNFRMCLHGYHAI